MESQNVTRVRELFRQVRTELLSAAEESPATSGKVIHATRMLDDLEQMCLEQVTPGPKRARAKQYYRTISVRGVCLAETWESAKQPFLVPKPLYDRCAGAVAHFTTPTPFAKILNHLRRTDADAPDYALRTCLRFWRDLESPLLEVTGSRYRALDTGRFAKATGKAWSDLVERQD